MVVGIGIVIWQLKDMAGESPEPIQIISKISFVIFIIYIIQVLLKLYRYNMLSAYFFTACCDALDMHDELDDKKRDTFEKLIKVLVPDLGFFNETDPPKLSDLTTGKDKKE